MLGWHFVFYWRFGRIIRYLYSAAAWDKYQGLVKSQLSSFKGTSIKDMQLHVHSTHIHALCPQCLESHLIVGILKGLCSLVQMRTNVAWCLGSAERQSTPSSSTRVKFQLVLQDVQSIHAATLRKWFQNNGEVSIGLFVHVGTEFRIRWS